MFNHYDLFEARLYAISKDCTAKQANDLCAWVIEMMDQDEWLDCRSMMQHEGIDCYLLSERIAECGVTHADF